MSTAYRVLLYYKYVSIKNPEQFAKDHLQLCNELELKGRILVASEGINGTVSGRKENTDQYIEHMRQNPLFQDMEYKIDYHEKHAFKKMHVRHKKELVTFRVENDLDPNKKTGTYLSPKEFYELLQQDDVVVLDGRNDYEYDLGHFRGAIRPEVKSFREFPDWIRENMAQFKGRKVLTYCTGGIRCEKLSAFMIEEGFQDVSQLSGGIVTYGKDPEVQGKLFDGKCYVFDERISVPINLQEPVIIGACHHCGTSSERYVNCTYDYCHKKHLCCPSCEQQHKGYCSTDCKTTDVSEQINA